jgi:hypothetical protein
MPKMNTEALMKNISQHRRILSIPLFLIAGYVFISGCYEE